MSSSAHEEGPAPPPLSDDEAAFRSAFASLVDFHRVSQARALWRAFWPGGLLLLPLGTTLTALSVSPGVLATLPHDLAPYLALLGVAVTGAGPVWCMVSLLRSIRRDDLYVAIRTDGMCLRLDATRPPEVVPWPDVREVRFEAASARVVVETTATRFEIRDRFVDVELEELARKLRDARRLSVWNRLHPRLGSR